MSDSDDCENENEEHKNENGSLSSESASLSSGTETNHTGGVSNDSSLSIARAETRAVNRSKVMVLLVIAIAAAACGTATYFFTSAEEEDNFHSEVSKEWMNSDVVLRLTHHSPAYFSFCNTTSSKTLRLKSLIFLILRLRISTAPSRVSLPR
jgi:glycerol uptake facilitator-like aquaporin